MKACCVSIAVALAAGLPSLGLAAGDGRHVPTVDDLLAVKSLAGVQISPDGRSVVYGVSEADFEHDAFVTQLWRVSTGGGEPVQLTRGQKSAESPRWSPDGGWIAFTSTRAGDKSQLFAIRPDGGEAVQLTRSETGVTDFAWSPDGRRLAFLASEPESEARKGRKEHLGDFEVIRRDYGHAHVFTVDLSDALREPVAGAQRTKGREFHVRQIAWSPDGRKLAFSATVNPDLVQSGTADLYVLDLEGDAVRKLVATPGPDTSPRWSPDGREIVFSSAMGRPDWFSGDARLAVVPADGGAPRSITDAFDEQPSPVEWNAAGIFFSGSQRTAAHLFAVDPASKSTRRVSGPDALIAFGFSFTKDGRQVAFQAASPTSLSEAFVSPVTGFAPRRLTDFSRQLEPLVIGRPEVIAWKSQDGTPIEGVLVKPADFDPTRRYPLLVQIHGGPTGVDRPTALTTRYYPSDAWLGRGALVLRVNYRGSAGYGEKFRQLNIRNLGVGDAWDVLSGIDDLIARGWVDQDRVGCMGWSQGGYISAFLTTSTTRCKAVSVGAGISNWATYYYNTDITPFTLNYLGDDPADDPEIYRKTSPMTYVKQARTPTLIQHGENDRRVPIANGYELRQGLEDRGVPVEMVVYKGFGHGINKPRAMRAVMTHNLQWFNHHLWGDPRPDFTAPDLPKKESKKDDAK
jgi:dipeptidyl aminopeptidase/acylaminoacyl peptidase